MTLTIDKMDGHDLVLNDSIYSINYRSSSLLFTNTIACLFGIRIRHVMECIIHVIDACVSRNMVDNTIEILTMKLALAKLN